MSKPPDSKLELSATLTLYEYQSPKSGNFGFWLYDKTQGMNLSMRAKTERDAFVTALHYYQRRLNDVEQAHGALKTKVDAFVAQFVTPDDEA